MSPPHPSPRTTPDGFIVVAVLWMLGALATLVSIYAVFVIDTAVAVGGHHDRLRTEALVSAALELTAHQLTAHRLTVAGARPTQGRLDFRMGQADIAVAFRSEAARIDLNAASKELLAGLIATFGVPRAGAEHYADRIIGWRTPPPKDQDSEASAYRAAGLKYVPRGARFPHVGELALVLDLPVDLIERLAPFVTVYSGRPQVNVLEAAPDVIAALPGMTRDRLHAVLAQRQAAPANGQAMMPLLGPAQGYATMEGAKASRITVQIAFDNGRRSAAEVVILVFEEGEEPYAILSWRDEWDAPRADNGPWTGSQ